MENIILTVLTISLSTSVVILALIVLGSLINKRYVAKWKYGIWIILALRLLIPIHYELPDAKLQITIPAEMGSMTVSDVFEAQPLVLDGQPTQPQMAEPIVAGTQAAAPLDVQPDIPEDVQASFTLLQAMGYLWLTGAVCLLVWQLAVFICYKRRIINRGNSTENPVLLEQLRELTQELDIRQQVNLLIYKNANSPMIIGFWRPILVLPGEDYTRDESFYILRHELIHLRRHDIFVKFLLLLARDFHWFNPVVYMMHREAVVDMELACDEAVVRGGSHDQRKAYTETLMSTLHRHQGRGTLLSTQFSGSKRVMKKRFRNILSKTRKRNGVILFAVILLLTVGIGTMVGYAMEEPAPAPEMQEEMPDGDMEEVNNASEEEAAGAETTREPTTVLTLMKEGFEEEEPATLYVGEGYSFYLIDGAWVQTSPGSWHATFHDRIQLWIDKYEGLNLNQVEEMLTEQGYAVSDAGLSAGLWKYEEDTDNMYRVYCYETESDVWTMNSVCFLEAEEGCAVGIRAMFETFAVTEGYHEGDLSAGIDGGTPQINGLLFGNVGNLGLGTLVYMVPDADDEDYRIYFFKSEDEEDRYRSLSEMNFDLSKASYIFPDVREGNVSIGKFKEMYNVDTTDISGNNIADVIVIAVYEADGKDHYDVRVYEAGENGYIVNAALTQQLNHRYYYYGEESYPVYNSMSLRDDSWTKDAQELGNIMTLFYTAYFDKDIETMRQYLSQSFGGNMSFSDEINSQEEVEVLGIKGLDSSVQADVGDECELSLEFRLPNEDSLIYLTVGFVKEDTGWKVSSYGLEK